MKAKLLPMIFTLFFLMTASAAAQDRTIHLNTSLPGTKAIFESLMRKVFAENGLEISVQILPPERSLYQANIGQDDGDGPRVAGLEKLYPDLVMVPEKIWDMRFCGFSKNTGIRLDGWDSLKPYRVGIIRGWKILEQNITDTKYLEITGDANHLFQLLDKDRIEIGVLSRLEGLDMIRKKNLQGISILSSPLAEREMFFYLHKKHGALVLKIAATLKRMKENGEYGNIVENALKEAL